jgi:glucokinase
MLVGIDIGGTKMLAIAATVNDRGTPASPATAVDVAIDRRVPTPKVGRALVEEIVALVSGLDADTGTRSAAVAIGIAGLVDTDGTVHFSPHLPDVRDLALATELQRALDRPVAVENDLTTATIAEARMGAGRGCRDFVMVGLGTGIGTKFFVGGQLVRGAHGFAGEAGHMTVDRDGPRHVTGMPGPWEGFASGSALGALGQTAAQQGRASRLIALAGSAAAVTGETVAKAVAEGDSGALAVLDAFAEQVAIGLGSLVCVLDPEKIVVGGGVSEIGEPLRSRIEQRLPQWFVGGPYRPAVPVVLAQLGETAGALGAVLRASDAAS